MNNFDPGWVWWKYIGDIGWEMSTVEGELVGIEQAVGLAVTDIGAEMGASLGADGLGLAGIAFLALLPALTLWQYTQAQQQGDRWQQIALISQNQQATQRRLLQAISQVHNKGEDDRIQLQWLVGFETNNALNNAVNFAVGLHNAAENDINWTHADALNRITSEQWRALAAEDSLHRYTDALHNAETGHTDALYWSSIAHADAVGQGDRAYTDQRVYQVEVDIQHQVWQAEQQAHTELQGAAIHFETEIQQERLDRYNADLQQQNYTTTQVQYEHQHADAGDATTLVTALAATTALGTFVKDWLNRCGDPLCKNLSNFGNVIGALESLGLDALLVALIIELFNDPGAVAHEVATVVKPVVDVPYNLGADMTGLPHAA